MKDKVIPSVNSINRLIWNIIRNKVIILLVALI